MSPVRLLHSWPALLMLGLLMFLPVYGPGLAYVEGQLFPVTSKVTTFNVSQTAEGTTDFQFSYTKLRELCEIVTVRMEVQGTDVQLERTDRGTPLTRPGGQQVSRIWNANVPSIAGAEMWFVHRCHPFWLVVTKVLERTRL